MNRRIAWLRAKGILEKYGGRHLGSINDRPVQSYPFRVHIGMDCPAVRISSSGTHLAHRNRPQQHSRAIAGLNLLMASQPNIPLTTWVDRPRQVSQSLVRDADFTSKWIIDLLSDKAPPGPKPCAAVAQLVTDEWR